MNININENEKILIVSPHADDESIGCGGLLSRYGRQCDLLLLTDGRNGHTTEKYSNESELIEIRKKEFKQAATLANVNQIVFLNIKDGTLSANKKEVYNYAIREYDYIFVPNRYESHSDHKIVLSIFRKMKRKQKAKAKIFEYEVWTPLRHPTWFLDISGVAANKEKMIGQHISQLADINYVQKGMALSCYRGMFNNTMFSEAFCYAEYSGIKALIYTLLPDEFKKVIRQKFEK